MEPDTGHVWVTPKTRELFLFASDEDLNDESFFEAVYPEDRERVNQAVQQALQSGKNLHCDYRIVQPDGSIRWIVARGQRYLKSTGEPVRMIGVSIDITERKQAEEALEDRLRFEGLVSHLSARFMNISPDRVDSEIENGLRRFLEFFQVDHCALLQSLPGKTSWQITHVASSDDVPPLPAGAELSRSIYPWGYEKLTEKNEVLSISRLDDLPAEANVDRQTCIEWGIRSYVTIPISIGDSVDHIIHVNSVKSERDWPEDLFPRLRLLGEIFVNAIERKRTELEAFATRRELLRSERLHRMGELTASLAHELNQPLTAILSNARAALRFIESGTLDMDELKEILQDIASDDKRAGDIIRTLRSMVKPEQGEREPVATNDLLREVVTLFNSEAVMRNIKVEVDLADALPQVVVNKVQLQEVVVNLMMNAAESMLDVPDDKRIVIRSRADSGAVQVAVCDTGPGIGEKELARLFEPFFTTKRSGLGMGLSLSRSIIEAHGGRLCAKNNETGGATFTVTLPAVKR